MLKKNSDVMRIDWMSVFKNPTIRERVVFTLMMIFVYRIGVHVPLPFIDPGALAEFFVVHEKTILGFLNTLSGGALGNMSVMFLGLMPYITSSIMVQLLTSIHPHFETLKKDGNQETLTQYTRYGTILLSIFYSYTVSLGLNIAETSAGPLVFQRGWVFIGSSVISVVGGTLFLMWIGEQITRRGLGQGSSIIIFAGIVSGLCKEIYKLMLSFQTETGDLKGLLIRGGILFILMILVAFFEMSYRVIFVNGRGGRVPQSVNAGEHRPYIPMKLNVSGVTPAIFTNSLMLLPSTIFSFGGITLSPDSLQAYIASLFAQGQPLFILFNGLLIGFFCFFYAPISFNCEETADQLKKNGVFISGLRPGQKTTQYLLAILYRVTCLGAIYLMTLCVIPEIFGGKSSLAFGGTSLLILVGTTIDLLSQVKVFSHQERKDLSGKLQACIRLWSPRLSS